MAVPAEGKLPSDAKPESHNGELDAETDEPVGILETQATFNDFIVWGHEALPPADDPFVKGVEEWLKFAEVVCRQVVVSASLIRIQMHSSSSQPIEDRK